ncbi:putative uncharacterized protein [Mycoplasma sp. CAG:956]|nr:putative uncharacterized protein [Mycoplasma sp. CAG:956]
MKKKVIILKNIRKNFGTLKVLENITCEFREKTFYAILGESGTGKTTLINILGLLDTSYNGTYLLNNINVLDSHNKSLTLNKSAKIGFVFQDYQLLQNMTALENVMIPMLLNNEIKRKNRRDLAIRLLKKVGLEDRKDHYPKELSGGEQQRVAIARALANNPEIILADEPTGNLDKKNETAIFELLKNISQDGKCVIIVSHSLNITNYADYIYKLQNGKIFGEKNENS